MTSLCFLVQLADRTSILAKGVFLSTSLAVSFLNHSPSEWFSICKKAAGRFSAGCHIYRYVLLRFVTVFFSRSHSASDMALRFIDFENRLDLPVKLRIDVFQAFAYVFMYRAFAHAEFFGGASYSRAALNDIFAKLYGAFLHYPLQMNNLPLVR